MKTITDEDLALFIELASDEYPRTAEKLSLLWEESSPLPPSVGGEVEVLGRISMGVIGVSEFPMVEPIYSRGLKFSDTGTELVDRQHVTALSVQLAASQARMAELESAVKENHEWHQQYDEHDGYAGSALEQTNTAALVSQFNKDLLK